MTQKVLVFESDQAFAGELRDELQKLGCTVQVVDDGNTGLQQAASARPDLILLSIELPRMNGFSVCNKLKKDPSLKDVPLIIMSSESSDETFEQHRKLRTRAEDYVHKPIPFGELLQRITTFVPALAAAGPAIGEDLYRASQAPQSMDAEALDDGDIVVEDMASRPPSMPPVVDHGGNGAHSLDAALAPPSDAMSAAVEPEPEPAPEPEPEPAPKRSERPRAAKAKSEAPPPTAPGDDRRVKALENELEAANDKIRELESKVDDAAGLQKEVDDLKQRLTTAASGKTGGVSSREFLDLREQLNKKDKEILGLKEQLSRKDKEIVEGRDKSLSFERNIADLEDKVLAHERELAERSEKIDALKADKDQAKKASEDFKRRAERNAQEAEARANELSMIKDAHASELAAKDEEVEAARAEAAATVERERAAAQASLTAAEERRAQEVAAAEERRTQEVNAAEERRAQEVAAAEEQRTRELAAAEEQRTRELAAAEERRTQELTAKDVEMSTLRGEHAQALEAAAADKTAALEAAAKAAEEAKNEAVAERELELKSEADSKLAALHRAHGDATSKLRAEHDTALADLRRQLEADRDEKVAAAVAAGEANVAAAKQAASDAAAAIQASFDAKLAAQQSEAEEQQRTAQGRIDGLTGELNTANETIATRDARVRELEDKVTELMSAKNGVEKDLANAQNRTVVLEAELASLKQSHAEATSLLSTRSAALEKASAKIEADKASLERAKDALAVALQQIEEAEAR